MVQLGFSAPRVPALFRLPFFGVRAVRLHVLRYRVSGLGFRV